MFSSNGLGSVPDEAALRIKVYGKAIRIKSGLGLLGNRLDCAKDIACRRLDRTHDIGCRRQDETNDVGNQLVFRLQRRQYVERTRAVKGAVDIGCLELRLLVALVAQEVFNDSRRSCRLFGQSNGSRPSQGPDQVVEAAEALHRRPHKRVFWTAEFKANSPKRRPRAV